MRLSVELVRRFNRICPWQRVKPWMAERVQARLSRELGERLYDGIDGGLRFHLDLSRQMHRRIYLNAYQPPITSRIKKVLRPGDTYLDIGASIGFFVVMAARSVGASGRVIAYEPQPYHCEILRRNIEVNGLKNVTLRPVACWSSPGRATLHRFAGAKPTTSSLAKRPDKEVAGQLQVDTVRIDDEVTGLVRLVKIDVEGAEKEALLGARGVIAARPHPHLLVELNPKTTVGFGYHPIEVVDWLLGIAPYRMTLLRSRRSQRIGRDVLLRLFQQHPMKTCNVHFEPAGS